MSQTLVTYFSASGVTANAAKILAQAAGADLYRNQTGSSLYQSRSELDGEEKQEVPLR